MPDGTPAALPEVVRELYARFGEKRFVRQSTKDDVPTLWVAQEDRDAVLRFLKTLAAAAIQHAARSAGRR